MKNVKRNVIVSAFMAIALCMSIVAGATFALFTSNSSVNIAITSGNVQVTATASDLVVYSPKSVNETGIVDAADISDNTNEVKVFGNGGTATLTGSELKLDNMTPGDKATFKITVKNESTVAVKYRTVIEAADEGLLAGLKISIGGKTVVGATEWQKLEAKAEIPDAEKACVIELPVKTNGDYKGKSCTLTFKVEATQGNAIVDYPDDLTDDMFDEATANGESSYTDHLGSHTAEANAAYKDGDTFKYVPDLKTATDNGVNVLYCKKNADMKARYKDTNRTAALTGDITIYANGADFGSELASGQITLQASADTPKVVNVTVYDAKNLAIWGNPTANGVTYNVKFVNCTYNGKGGEGIVMFRGEKTATDVLNLTLENCTVTSDENANCDGVHFTCAGNVTIKNCTFKGLATGVNVAYKSAGELSVIIENSTFEACGLVDPSNDYRAPVRLVTTGEGTLKAKLSYNVFKDTVGTNGDVLLGDYRNGKTSKSFVTEIVTNKTITVKSSAADPAEVNATQTITTFNIAG